MRLNFQTEKQIVLNFYDDLQKSKTTDIPEVMTKHCSEDLLWRGFHPFNEIVGSKNVGIQFWQPLFSSLVNAQRRMDIFLAGFNEIKGNEGIWIVSMGNILGLFDFPWIGIKPTRKLSMLRYCEFNKVTAGKITETAMFFDIPHLMIQTGLMPFPPATGSHLVQPGPISHDGLMFEKQNPAQGKLTKKAIEDMINDLKTWKTTKGETLVEELRRTWNEDMIWWGPAGIGATYTIERYAKQHSGPFREGFKNRKFNGHVCRVAEGNYGGFFGWPNLTLTPSGGFMGMPASQAPGDMRVIDMYRIENNKLSENWVFIDLLHFWMMQGVDILKRTIEINSDEPDIH